MDNLKPKDVKKIARLARLQLNEEQIKSISQDMNNILTLVEQMNKLDTGKIKPMAHPFDETQPLREDQVTEKNQRELYQSIAPETYEGLYLVPQVIDKD